MIANVQRNFTINFNGKAVSLMSLTADITPDIYTQEEGREMLHILKPVSRDELDSGRSSHSTAGMTYTDGERGFAKFDLRLDPRRMVHETHRLETYQSWPESNPLRPGKLAKAGFYYTGIDDEVKCFSCGGQIRDWEFGNTAMGEHERLYPDCGFVKRTDLRNVSLLEIRERPGYEQRLGSRIEQSQRDIEKRAKEKEALLEREASEKPGESSVAGGRRDSLKGGDNENVTEEDEGGFSILRYNKEYERLKSFKKWPRTSPIEPRDLAKAGFYYTNVDDTVQCFACFGQISKWNPSDIPAVEHRHNFPNCPYVQGLDVENVPLSTPPVYSTGKPPLLHSASAPQPTPAQIRAGRQLQREDSGQLRAYLGPLNKCRHPIYVKEDARLQTFHSWPTNMRIMATPRMMARAGFFFTGTTDEVKCFYCDGGLKNWEPEDDPWTEHAKWFPRCEWLIQQRGQAFISHVQRVNPPPFASSGEPPTQGKSEQDYPWTSRHAETEPLIIESPSPGHDEPYLQQPPRRVEFLPHQQHAPWPCEAQATSSHHGESKKTEGLTVEDEKKAAHRELCLQMAEPEAGVEKSQLPKPKASSSGHKSHPKLAPVDTNMARQTSIDDILMSPTTQMVIEMGYDEKLVYHVVTEHLHRTGHAFSTPEDLLEAIWEAQEKGASNSSPVDERLLSTVAGRHDSEDEEYHLKKPQKELESKEHSRAPCAIDVQAKKLASLSINDDPADDEAIKARRVLSDHQVPSGISRVQAPHTLSSGTLDLQSLQDKQLCIICLDNEKNTVFLPCKHLSTCERCASRLKECPLCRQPILTSFRVFMP